MKDKILLLIATISIIGCNSTEPEEEQEESLTNNLIFRSADFTVNKSLFLLSGKMRFGCQTTLEEISKAFPEAI